MKVIFLDFDGVLINSKSLREAIRAKADPVCVAALNRITDATGALIVVSSTWRIGFTVNELRELLTSWGVTGTVLDKTPVLQNHKGEITIAQPRYMEIMEWIQRYCGRRSDLEVWAVLDDEANMGPLFAEHIRTQFEIGLTMDAATTVIELLNAPIEVPQ